MKHAKYNADVYEFVEMEGSDGYYVGIDMLPPNTNPAYNYKYNGKEFQDELGLNVYSYGWRDYDPAIGRFMKIDRFAEKYGMLSPYSYAGNNPILFIDIAGDSIGLGRNHFERFRSEVQMQKNNILENRQKRIDKLLKKGKTSQAEELQASFAREDSRSNSQMNILNSTLSELEIMESSTTQVYNLFVDSNDVPANADGITMYNTSTNAVDISIKGSFNIGVFAHELKHAYQFQSGALSFGGNGRFGGFLYDLNDEYEAFDRGSFFGGKNLTRNEINMFYPNRPSGPINLNTPNGQSSYGHQMRLTTARNASLGTAQNQFYINWRNN